MGPGWCALGAAAHTQPGARWTIPIPVPAAAIPIPISAGRPRAQEEAVPFAELAGHEEVAGGLGTAHVGPPLVPSPLGRGGLQ